MFRAAWLKKIPAVAAFTLGVAAGFEVNPGNPAAPVVLELEASAGEEARALRLTPRKPISKGSIRVNRLAMAESTADGPAAGRSS